MWEAGVNGGQRVYRGARITRTRSICWRPSNGKDLTGIVTVERGDCITSFKRKYSSSPMEQLLRSLASREELANDADRGGKAGRRLHESGRSKRA